jgi:biotin carboxylase
MKKIIFLGASFQQLSPIEYANSRGYFTITCDNRPDNPGHRIANRSYNVSTTEKDHILAIAREENIDGVVCYGSDVSAPTAAYISENLGLPGNPYDSVVTLTNKNRFREFQKKNGFYYPKSLTIDSVDQLDQNLIDAELSGFSKKLVVKPVDANACKGISITDDRNRLADAISKAAEYSISKKVIIEEYVSRKSYQICGEGFLQDGLISFYSFANEHFTESTIVPVGESFPSIHHKSLTDKAAQELQRIFTLLDMSTGPFNVDLFITKDNEIFIVEIGPRNGGNRMPDAIKYASGVDTISATIESAIGNAISLNPTSQQFVSTYSIHTVSAGILSGIKYNDEIKSNIVDELLFYEIGDPVKTFDMGSNMIGNLILKFDSYDEMINKMENMSTYVQAEILP